MAVERIRRAVRPGHPRAGLERKSDGDEIVSLEGSTSDEAAVDILLSEKFLCI